MKSNLISAVLGLTLGWIVSLAVDRRESASSAADQPDRPEISTRSQISAPAPVTARSALSLNQQRAERRAGGSFSPYREKIFSRDLIESLDTEQLIEALRAGQILDPQEIASAFRRITRLDPMRALEILPEISGHANHQAAELALTDTWAEIDADGMIRFVRNLPDTEWKSDLAYNLAVDWIRHDPTTAMKHFDEFKGMVGVFKSRLADRMLGVWAEADFEAAEKWVVEESSPAQRETLRDSLLAGHMSTLNGVTAVDFVRDRPEREGLQKKLTYAYQNWAMDQPREALEDFVTNPRDHAIWLEIEQMGRAAMINTTMLDGDLAEVLAMAAIVPEGEARRQFLLGAANMASSNEFESAKTLIAEIPESRERNQAIGMFTELHMREDPVALSEWLTALEPSESRDQAVATFARLLAKSDAERARSWAETIADDRERKRALNRISD